MVQFNRTQSAHGTFTGAISVSHHVRNNNRPRAFASIMNVPDPKSIFGDQDDLRRQGIRDQMRSLLNQRAELAHLEKVAAVKETTMDIAHDIRNPLATIAAVCGSLILETTDPEQRERLQLINSQVDRLTAALSSAVDHILDGEDAPARLNLSDLAHSLVNLLQYQTAKELEFHLCLEPDLWCRLPERGLTRSIYHLVRNATDALAEHPAGEVTVTCRGDDDRVAIRIEDNGPGLPQTLLDGGVRTLPSTASGLSSVERFARGLGGCLSFANSPGGGATVSLLLPMDCRDRF